MMGALVLEDPEILELHLQLVQAGATVQAMRRNPETRLGDLWAAETRFASARGAVHEKCALVVA